MNRLVRLVAVCLIAIAAAGGIADAGIDEANSALRDGDYATAHAEALPLAKAGDPVAQWLLATLYAEGWGVDRNDDTATRWYAKAAKGGLPAAQFAYGQRMAAGRGIEPDLDAAADWLKKAAAQGQTDADLTLGTIYASRQDLAGSDPQGAARLRHEIETGSAPAEYAIGRCYELGMCGVDEDASQAVGFYRVSAAREFPAAQFRLGLSYMDGRGSPVDRGRGLEWIGQAARNDDIDAQRFLADKLRTGEGGIPVNIRGANHWAEKLKARGAAETTVGSVALKTAADRPRSVEKAPERAKRAPKAETATTASATASATKKPLEPEVTKPKPVSTASATKTPSEPKIRKSKPLSTVVIAAATPREPEAVFDRQSPQMVNEAPPERVATIVPEEPEVALSTPKPDPSVDVEALFKEASQLNVKGAPKADHKQARALFTQAAEAGYAPAQSMLGQILYYAIGGPRDVAEAVTWIRRAAEQGHPRGQFNYGLLLSTGKGVAKDRDKAIEWYRKSAKQGFGGAQINLAYFLGGLDRKGSTAAPEDLTESLVWATLAAEQRTPNSVRILKKIKSRVSEEQKKEARSRVIEWQARHAD